jgi:SNF family Na+-dependent transporter
MEKLWFKRKRFGYGWTPVTWQGWLVIAAYVASLVFFANNGKNFVKTSDIVIGVVVPIIMFTALLILVCIVKGEKPKWQWGRRKDEK